MKRFVAAPYAAIILAFAAGSIGAQAKSNEEIAVLPDALSPEVLSPDITRQAALNCEVGGLTPAEAREARPSRLQILWNPAEEAEVVRDGDVLAVKLGGAGGVLRGERAYALTEVELRARDGSERYPAEARFIHKNAFGDQVVVGVYLTEGETNPAFETLRTAADGGKAVDGLDPRALLPADKGRLVMASRTPPACAPRVMWTVVDEPVEASREQLMALLQLPADRPIRGGAE